MGGKGGGTALGGWGDWNVIRFSSERLGGS